MKSLIRFVWVMFWCCIGLNPAAAQRNFLTGPTGPGALHGYLTSIGSWRAARKDAVDREISHLPDSVKQQLVLKAEKCLHFTWPNLPAMTYLQFGETGNRTRYEKIRGERRQILSALAIGELIENKGRFIPDLVNGIWAVCEESTWAYPAHLGLQKKYSPLPDPGENVVDLGAAGTAEILSWTYLLLRQQLDSVSPIVAKRIQFELEKRIIDPYLSRSDFWWMGLKGQSVNNWNPTVNSGVLLTALLAEKNPVRMDSAVYKTMRSVDVFINQYPADGGCDEGPGYWSMAGGALIGYLTRLKDATGGKVDIAANPLIGNMGRFIYLSNIDQHYFVNYGDAHATVTPNVTDMYEYGLACKNDTLRQFASWFAKEKGTVFSHLTAQSGNLDNFVGYLGLCQQLAQVPARQPLVRQSWLPGLQQMTVRSVAGTAKGLFLGAKGGTNGASHNHNDVGNFIIYSNGMPAIIDLGVGTYTRQTFSKDRYKLFTMQSAWHNLPVINGYMQQAGSRFKAEKVDYRAGPDQTCLSMDLAGAYPDSAAVISWLRTLKFRGTQIDLNESYRLKAFRQPGSLSLITPLRATLQKNRIILKGAASANSLVIYFDPRQLKPAVESKKMDDPSLEHAWGKEVYRIRFEIISHQRSGSYWIRFRQE